MAKKLSFVFSAAALLLSGCAGLTNLTPEKIPENSSGLYTLSMSAHINDGSIVPGSIEPFIVIDENTIPMKTVKISITSAFTSTITASPRAEGTQNTTSPKYKVRNTVEDGEQERTLTSPTVYKARAPCAGMSSPSRARGGRSEPSSPCSAGLRQAR